MTDIKDIVYKGLLAYLAAYVGYRLLLEAWCVAYGLIY
jgi:hypothetical protein